MANYIASGSQNNGGKIEKSCTVFYTSRHTIERQISVISADTVSNLQDNLLNCAALSLELDKSTDIPDTPQLAILFVLYEMTCDGRVRLDSIKGYNSWF